MTTRPRALAAFVARRHDVDPATIPVTSIFRYHSVTGTWSVLNVDGEIVDFVGRESFPVAGPSTVD